MLSDLKTGVRSIATGSEMNAARSSGLELRTLRTFSTSPELRAEERLECRSEIRLALRSRPSAASQSEERMSPSAVAAEPAVLSTEARVDLRSPETEPASPAAESMLSARPESEEESLDSKSPETEPRPSLALATMPLSSSREAAASVWDWAMWSMDFWRASLSSRCSEIDFLTRSLRPWMVRRTSWTASVGRLCC